MTIIVRQWLDNNNHKDYNHSKTIMVNIIYGYFQLWVSSKWELESVPNQVFYTSPRLLKSRIILFLKRNQKRVQKDVDKTVFLKFSG